MADISQVAPGTLESIFSQNPGMWGMAQDYMNRANQGNDLSQQHMILQNQFDAAQNPQLLQHQADVNASLQAQLPGTQANSAMLARKNQNEATINPQVIKDLQGKYSSAELARHVQDLDQAGELMAQGAGTIAANPIAGKAALKAKLEASGHGDLWNPEWDNPTIDPQDLFNAIDTTGKQIQSTSSKFRQMFGSMSTKAEIASQLEAQKQEGRVALRDRMSQTAQAIAAAHDAAKMKLDKPSAEQAAVRMNALADQAQAAGDADSEQKYRAKANEMLNEARALKASGAATTNEPKVSIEGVTNGAVPEVGKAAPPALGGGAPKPAATGLKYKSAEGQSWVQRALQANPGMSEADVIMNGKKSGKLVD